MKYEPPPDGLHRETHPNGKPSFEYTIKNGELHGLWRQWHSNGQLISEISFVRGNKTGRMRWWDESGILYGTRYFFERRQVSKKRYLELCNADPKLPRFIDEKITNTLGNYVRRMRREAKQRPIEEQIKEQLTQQQYWDKWWADESKEANSKEALSWLEKGKRGNRELGEMGLSKALKLIRKLYALGAVKIWATGIERDADGSQYSNHLIVALPDDKVARGKFFELCTEQARPFLTIGSPAIRFGQRYMSVSLL